MYLLSTELQVSLSNPFTILSSLSWVKVNNFGKFSRNSGKIRTLHKKRAKETCSESECAQDSRELGALSDIKLTLLQANVVNNLYSTQTNTLKIYFSIL